MCALKYLKVRLKIIWRHTGKKLATHRLRTTALMHSKQKKGKDIVNLVTYLSWNVLAVLFISSFISCLLFIHALLLVDCATLLIRNTSVNLMAFLFVNCKHKVIQKL